MGGHILRLQLGSGKSRKSAKRMGDTLSMSYMDRQVGLVR